MQRSAATGLPRFAFPMCGPLTPKQTLGSLHLCKASKCNFPMDSSGRCVVCTVQCTVHSAHVHCADCLVQYACAKDGSSKGV